MTEILGIYICSVCRVPYNLVDGQIPEHYVMPVQNGHCDLTFHDCPGSKQKPEFIQMVPLTPPVARKKK